MQTDASKQKDNDIAFKIVLVGDTGVGKTSIMQRFLKKQPPKEHNTTIGVEFSVATVQIDPDTTIQLQLWDTAGQESFRSIVKTFYRNAAGIFLIYDVGRRDSFEHIVEWLEEARTNSELDAVLVLMGNQADRDSSERRVQSQEGERLMREKGINFFFESSAMNGQNIDIAFREAAKMLLLRYLSEKMKAGETQAPGKSLNLNESRSLKIGSYTKAPVQNNKKSDATKKDTATPNKSCC